MENIILEILPPPILWEEGKIANYSKDIVQLLKRQNVAYVGIPEVINEGRHWVRNWPFTPKMDNVVFVEQIQQLYPKMIPIIYKTCVRMPKDSFIEWINKVYEIGVRHVVLVGGEHAEIDYIGYSVVEAASIIKKLFPEIKVGGITIFTRRKETERITEKMNAGIDFFFSQIIFETMNMKQILLNLIKFCKNDNLPIPKIFLSFALASRVKDVEFMKWLGVEFPAAVADCLVGQRIVSIEEQSFDIIKMLLDEIFHFTQKENIQLGFNIEHLLYTNLRLSESLFNEIKQRIGKDANFIAGSVSKA